MDNQINDEFLTIPQHIEIQVEKKPYDSAIICDNHSITYSQLNSKANFIARLLLKRGVKVGTIVGVLQDRSTDLLVTLLAILKAGGAYLPIDPAMPTARIEYMLKDSNVEFLLTDTDEHYEFEGITINIKKIFIPNDIYENLDTAIHSYDLAYVIYTSGSTGKPKGVMIEHGSVHNLINSLYQRIDFDGCYTFLSTSTMSFDVFVVESLFALSKGFTIHLATKYQQGNPQEIIRIIKTANIDVLQTTPTKLQQMISASDNEERWDELKVLLIGGEKFSSATYEKVKIKTTAFIYNLYGPTETTVWTTLTKLEDANVTVGTPIFNTQLFIMDEDLSLKNIGETGELFIAGVGLARGYINRPDLTAEKFIVSPYNGERMYRTGDVARITKQGQLEVLGRTDNQIKHRGYRIELEEIESILLTFPAIEFAAVLLNSESEVSQLNAFIVVKEEIKVRDVEMFLSTKLPPYMLPDNIFVVKEFPITFNGKLDRNTFLQQFNKMRKVNINGHSKKCIEQFLINNIQELINKKDQHFMSSSLMELGFDSLTILKLYAKLSGKYGNAININELYRAINISSLAQTISISLKNITVPDSSPMFSPTSTAQTRINKYVDMNISSAQDCYISVCLPLGNSNIANIFTSINYRGHLTVNKLNEALAFIVARHDSLRSTFVYKRKKLYQRFHQKKNIPKIPFFNLSKHSNDEIAIKLKQIEITMMEPNIDIHKYPLFKVSLVKTGRHQFIINFVTHHLIADGVSIQILRTELLDVIEQLNNSNVPILPPVESYQSLNSHMVDQQIIDVSKCYWETKFKNLTGETTFNSKRKNMTGFGGRSFSYCRFLDDDLVRDIKKYCKSKQCSFFVFMLTNYYLIMFETLQTNQISISIPLSGRYQPGASNVIGLFATLGLTRIELLPRMTFNDILQELNNQIIANQNYYAYKYSDLVKLLKQTNCKAQFPITTVMFNQESFSVGSEIFFNVHQDNGRNIRFDIQMMIRDNANKIALDCVYREDVFSKKTIETLVNRLISTAKTNLTYSESPDYNSEGIKYDNYQS